MMLITTLVVSFSFCCMLEVKCGLARVVSGLQAKAIDSKVPKLYLCVFYSFSFWIANWETIPDRMVAGIP